MHLRENEFNEIKAAIKAERGNMSHVYRDWYFDKSYNTIRQINKCEDFQEYKAKYQPSKVEKCHDHTPAGIWEVRLGVKPTSEKEMRDWMEHISNQQEEILKRLENLKIIF